MRTWCVAFPTVLLLLGLARPPAQSQTPPSSPKPEAAITLDDAIRLAEANEPAFAAAAAEGRATALERKDARAGLLPSVSAHNQYLFTESNHLATTTAQGGPGQSLPIFIANNAVHEYIAQGVVTETVGLAPLAAVQLADAN